jgi:hypothetical protein
VEHVFQPDPAVFLSIQQACMRYAWGVDLKDWDLFRSAFVDDCRVSFTGPPPERRNLGGVEGIDAVVDYVAYSHEQLDTSLHGHVNLWIVACDGETADVWCGSVAQVTNSKVEGDTYVNAIGQYHDLWRRVGENDWRIVTREYTTVFREGNDACFPPWPRPE